MAGVQILRGIKQQKAGLTKRAISSEGSSSVTANMIMKSATLWKSVWAFFANFSMKRAKSARLSVLEAFES